MLHRQKQKPQSKKDGGRDWSRTNVAWASTRSKTVLRPVLFSLNDSLNTRNWLSRLDLNQRNDGVSDRCVHQLHHATIKWRSRWESDPHLRFCGPPPIPVLTTRPMVAEKGIEPIPSVSETEALPLCNSAFEMASTSRIELLSTVLETVAQPLYHVLMVLVEGFEPPPRRTCS